MGAALALLALYRATRLPEALDKAALCGEHLLQHRSASRQGPRAWKTLGEEMLTGFSHGAAEIAYALLKLYEATGERSFREAALEAEAFESSVFLPEVSNWPDFRFPPTEHGYVHRTAWCHGARGIALSRLAALPILDTPQVCPDISHGLRATRLAGTQGLDTVCCGAMGRVEALVVAAKELRDPAYQQQAQKMASSILRRSRHRGSYALGWKKSSLPRFVSPGDGRYRVRILASGVSGFLAIALALGMKDQTFAGKGRRGSLNCAIFQRAGSTVRRYP
jgi:lantibiotic modifying enzyme